MDGGSITGMNGIVIGIAKMRGLKGVCLLGETSGYVVDAKSSKSLLETLLSMIGMKVDMKDLERRAKDTEALIQTIEQQMGSRTGRILRGTNLRPKIGHQTQDISVNLWILSSSLQSKPYSSNCKA